MSEHDYVIDDADGTSFLIDINLAFKALASNNLSATEPVTMYAGMWWGDTTADLVKQRNAANTAWISWATLSTGAILVCAAANRVDSGEVSVTGHATTADIFGAAANSVLFDDAAGAITVIAIPAAAKAGMVRDVRYNGETKYTAGPNLLIEGVASGSTITLGAGAKAQFRARTTTQHEMTYSYSGSFTITGTGFAVNPTATATFKVSNGSVSLYVPASALTGTSNAPTFTLTGLPAAVVPNSGQVSPVFRATDNSANIMAIGTIAGGANVITLYNVTGAGWTASGTKTLVSTLIQWALD